MTCDTSHGWIKARADGARAKCGGPDICSTCQTEKMHESMLTACFGARHEPLPGPSLAASKKSQDDALLLILPFLEDMAECVTCKGCYKPGALESVIRTVRAAIGAQQTKEAQAC